MCWVASQVRPSERRSKGCQGLVVRIVLQGHSCQRQTAKIGQPEQMIVKVRVILRGGSKSKANGLLQLLI